MSMHSKKVIKVLLPIRETRRLKTASIFIDLLKLFIKGLKRWPSNIKEFYKELEKEVQRVEAERKKSGMEQFE